MYKPWLRRGIVFSLISAVALSLAACVSATPGGSQPAPAATQAAVAPVVSRAATQEAGPRMTAGVAPVVGATLAAAPAETPAASPGASATILAPALAPTAGQTAGAASVAAVAPTAASAATIVPEPAPACSPGALTPPLTEGPYYKANPPEESSLVRSGMSGTKLTITGYVLNANCQPVANARVDFWQADAAGQYDNNGYTLRGYQVTDAQGRYAVETVVPGLYPGRTRHIHVKVTPPGGATLTTQLFFPGEASNSSDSIFAAQNVLSMHQDANGDLATFNFVVKAG